MGIGTTIGILIVIFLAIIVGIVAAVIHYQKDDEEEDRPFCINFLSDFCDGVAYGVEQSVKTGKNGRKITMVSQRDILAKNIDKIKEVPVITEKNKIVSLPRGAWSSEKNINIHLPPSASDFPDAIKETEIGKALMLLTEIKNAVNSELATIKEGSRRKSEILNKLGDGELSREHLITIQELQKDLIKMAADVRKDKTSTTTYPSINPSGNP